MLDNILQGVYRKFEQDEQRKKQEEEEERAVVKANNFRIYNLSVKYFYRWRDNARVLRLSQLRRSGRDQMRQYREAQRAEQLRAQKAAARQAAREQAELAELNRPEELMDLIKHKQPRRTQEERDALLASGVLSGVNNEEEVVARIVRRAPSVNGSVSSKLSKTSRISAKGGSKTQALREQLLGERSASFRRSLPPMPSRDASSPDPSHRVSKVSERWRLKAMGIVQMPDGTAVPESLASTLRRDKQSTGTMGPPAINPIRRASVSDLSRQHNQPPVLPSSEETAKNKRKRPTEDQGDEAVKTSAPGNAHKRVMSDAQKLISELRSMREEMEEGATWFRGQNERLQSELNSRPSTPWEPDA